MAIAEIPVRHHEEIPILQEVQGLEDIEAMEILDHQVEKVQMWIALIEEPLLLEC